LIVYEDAVHYGTDGNRLYNLDFGENKYNIGKDAALAYTLYCRPIYVAYCSLLAQ